MQTALITLTYILPRDIIMLYGSFNAAKNMEIIMKNKTTKTVLCVVVGLALFALVAEAASLICQVFLLDDLLNQNATDGSVELYHDIKWSAVAVSSVLIAAVVCNILALASNAMGVKITSLAVNCVLIILSAVLMGVVRNDALYVDSKYAVGAAYISEILRAVSACTVLLGYGVFDLVGTVRGHKNKSLNDGQTATAETETEVESNEEN